MIQSIYDRADLQSYYTNYKKKQKDYLDNVRDCKYSGFDPTSCTWYEHPITR